MKEEQERMAEGQSDTRYRDAERGQRWGRERRGKRRINGNETGMGIDKLQTQRSRSGQGKTKNSKCEGVRSRETQENRKGDVGEISEREGRRKEQRGERKGWTLREKEE